MENVLEGSVLQVNNLAALTVIWVIVHCLQYVGPNVKEVFPNNVYKIIFLMFSGCHRHRSYALGRLH